MFIGENFTAQKGETVKIPCTVTEIPNYVATWFLNGDEIKESHRVYKTTSGLYVNIRIEYFNVLNIEVNILIYRHKYC